MCIISGIIFRMFELFRISNFRTKTFVRNIVLIECFPNYVIVSDMSMCYMLVLYKATQTHLIMFSLTQPLLVLCDMSVSMSGNMYRDVSV